MKKNKNILIFICFITALFDLKCQNIIPVKENNQYKENDITVKFKLKNNCDLVIFLINKTNDTISCFGGYNSKITFKKEVLDENKKWTNFDTDSKLAYWCGTGLTSLKIPTNYYTYEIYKNKRYSGDYRTKMRFSFRISDSINIYTKSADVFINKDLIISPELRAIKYLENEYGKEKLENEKIKLFKLLIRNYNYNGLFKKSILICKDWKGNENIDEVNFSYVKTISRFLQSNPKINKYNRIILRSKLIELIEKINSNNEFTDEIYKYREYHNKRLITNQEWNALDEKCENNLCFDNILTNDFVQIRFKK